MEKKRLIESVVENIISAAMFTAVLVLMIIFGEFLSKFLGY